MHMRWVSYDAVLFFGLECGSTVGWAGGWVDGLLVAWAGRGSFRLGPPAAQQHSVGLGWVELRWVGLGWGAAAPSGGLVGG